MLYTDEQNERFHDLYEIFEITDETFESSEIKAVRIA
ncbi:hypothetical protein J2S08_000271 [Bacillus chungangensis]|uniref:Uncharacterized protein n=1 Tax=Bacillus chungangensis TaxID=587633 RepID=A0ABT9WMN0_9BACI|nr:hypothetical protein [Bacillus chungangensis]